MLLTAAEFIPAYGIPVAIGLALFFLFPITRGVADRRAYYRLQIITFVGAILGSKLAVLIGDEDWPRKPLADWSLLLTSGRSIVGALILGFLFAEIAKPLLRYRMPPNDRFAAVLPFTIGVGRLGCLLAGCCRGLPYSGPLAAVDASGVARYPVQAMEMIFHISVGAAFMFMVRRRILVGRLFSLYLVLYGLYRFFTEFIRDTPKTLGPWSWYQVMALIMIALGAGFFIRRTLVPAVGSPSDTPSEFPAATPQAGNP